CNCRFSAALSSRCQCEESTAENRQLSERGLALMISALMIGAQQYHPPVPPTCAQQCTHLCHPAVRLTCAQQSHPPCCQSVPPVSAQRLCQLVPPIRATSLVLPISAHQCSLI
ncbi:unnamed protein product, partial [Staurois parvus]